MRKYKVAIAGATGVVGREMIKVLEEREFPVSELLPLASERSEGQKLEFQGREVVVRRLKPDSFAGVDIALFSPGASVSREFAPHAARAGAVGHRQARGTRGGVRRRKRPGAREGRRP